MKALLLTLVVGQSLFIAIFYPMPQNITHLCLNKAIVRAAECRAWPVNISTHVRHCPVTDSSRRPQGPHSSEHEKTLSSFRSICCCCPQFVYHPRPCSLFHVILSHKIKTKPHSPALSESEARYFTFGFFTSPHTLQSNINVPIKLRNSWHRDTDTSPSDRGPRVETHLQYKASLALKLTIDNNRQYSFQ